MSPWAQNTGGGGGDLRGGGDAGGDVGGGGTLSEGWPLTTDSYDEFCKIIIIIIMSCKIIL